MLSQPPQEGFLLARDQHRGMTVMATLRLSLWGEQSHE